MWRGNDQQALLLCTFAPGGFERRFERMLAEQSGNAIPDELLELTGAEHATRRVGASLPPDFDRYQTKPGALEDSFVGSVTHVGHFCSSRIRPSRRWNV